MGCKAAMDIDFPTEVAPAEETVDALMEYLVGPLLPLKHTDSAKEIPSESQQKSVAKQVHAAAVLYNYYHLKQHRESEFLKFDNFCNLAIMFKPSILHHMKYMCQIDRPVLDDLENQLSITEKAIMDACTISKTLLNASVNISSIIKEWPITKVAVLLIDSEKVNCFLKFNNGLWSVIEKNLYPEETEIGSQNVKKRKFSLMGNHDIEGDAQFEKLAFSAIKEAAGILNGDLKVLESHFVYSLSQAKTATRFYIVQSNRSICEDNLVPIQDVIFSLQGPVVKKSSGSWVITPVVEHYYLLPYAEIISKLFSRASDSLPPQVEEKRCDDNIILGTQKPCEKENGQNKSKLDLGSMHISNNTSKEEPCDSNVTNNIYKSNNLSNDATSRLIGDPVDQKVNETNNSVGNKIKDVSSDCMKKDMNGSCRVESNNSSSGANNKAVEKPLKVYSHIKRTTNSISVKENSKDLKKMSFVSQSKEEKVVGEKNTCIESPNEVKILTVDHPLISCQKKEFEEFQCTVDAKRSELSEAALRALLNKRQKLYNQQRVIEAELTLCDKKIQAIMHGGIGDCLGLKLEAVIDCCNEICQQDDMQTQEHKNLNIGRSLPVSGKSLSEAHLMLRKACQELDDICLSNDWMLATYNTSRLEGGFVANVTVKGNNFECSGVSGIQPSIHEARNSAATNVITRLQQMASEMNPAVL